LLFITTNSGKERREIDVAPLATELARRETSGNEGKKVRTKREGVNLGTLQILYQENSNIERREKRSV